jgi:WD40 repeat protein
LIDICEAGMRTPSFIVFALVLLAWSGAATAQNKAWHGLTFETLTPEKAEADGLLGVFQGARVTAVDRRSVARDDLQVGDAIVAAGKKPVAGMEALAEALGAVAEGDAIELVRMRSQALPARVTIKRPRPRKPIELASQPVLMLDTGGHMAKVSDVVFTPDGRQLVSASNDKIIRVWDLATGKSIRTIRGDVAPGSPGKIFAMALSPDGQWLAVAGWTDARLSAPCCGDIRVYDFTMGELVTPLKGHTSIVNGVAFSHDGAMLLSGSFDKTAILWQAPLKDGQPDWRKASLHHRLSGHTAEIYDVSFFADGKRAVTGANDNTLRVWDTRSGKMLAHLVGHSDKIDAIAISPSGLLASGDNSGELRLWPPRLLDGVTDGREVRTTQTLPKTGYIGKLRFSPDGRHLLATCGYVGCNTTQRVWDLNAGALVSRFKAHGEIVLAADWSPDGRWVATGGGQNKEIRIWNPRTGRMRPDNDGNALRLAGGGKTIWATGISADGKWIGWGRTWKRASPSNRGPVEFALRLPLGDTGLAAPVRVGAGSSAPTDWNRATVKHGAWSMRHRKGGSYGFDDANLDIMEAGAVRATIERRSSQGYGHSAYGLLPDGKSLISGGGDGVLAAYALDGKKIGNFVGHEGDVFAVTPSPNGRFLLTGSADQTVRLWNLESRELILTLFHAPAADGGVGEWVMWTPQGFYAGSRDAGRLVGWQLNNGPDKAADYVTGGQFRKTLNRPDIIEEAIRLASAKAAVTKLEPGFDLARFLAARPPSLTAVTPEPYAREFRGAVNITAFVDEGSFAVERYEVAVNGTKVETVTGTVPPGHRRPPEGQIVEAFSVPLADGRNIVEIRAFSAAGESQALRLPIDHTGEGRLDKRGRLYVVAVGIDDYAGLGKACGPRGDETCNLSYGGKDARLFMDTVTKALGSRHDQGTWSRLLTNQGRGSTTPTRRNILAALDGLANATEIDTVAVLLAGHGERGEDGRYYFLPTDIARGGGLGTIGKGRNIIEWSEIQQRLTAAKGRRMLFLDSCQSGALGVARAYNGSLRDLCGLAETGASAGMPDVVVGT